MINRLLRKADLFRNNLRIKIAAGRQSKSEDWGDPSAALRHHNRIYELVYKNSLLTKGTAGAEEMQKLRYLEGVVFPCLSERVYFVGKPKREARTK